MLGSIATGLGSIPTAADAGSSNGSGIIVPADWKEFADYFLMSKVPALNAPAQWTDFHQNGALTNGGIDWQATGSVQFPGQDSGGTVLLQTSFTTNTFKIASPAFPNQTDMYVASFMLEPWGAASRSMCLTATANTRAAFLSIMSDPIHATRLCIGINGPQSTSFLSAWYMSGDTVTNVLPVTLSIPYKGNGIYHELYCTYNGSNALIWGGGDYNRGIEPVFGGLFGEFSVANFFAVTAGVGIQSINGATLEEMKTGIVLAKCVTVR